MNDAQSQDQDADRSALAGFLAPATLLGNVYALTYCDAELGLFVSALMALSAIWCLAVTRRRVSRTWIPLSFCLSVVAVVCDLGVLLLFVLGPF